MADSFIYIICILFGSGVLGGLVDFLKEKHDKDIGFYFLQSIFYGIVASFMVPFFLHSISSNLLEEIKGGDDFIKCLVLVGFCLIASIYSRSFIASISEHFIKKKIEEEVTDEVEKSQTESEPSDLKNVTEGEPSIGISSDQMKILKAMYEGKYTYRTIGGIARGADLKRDVVEKEINGLISKGLVAQGEREKSTRWYLTDAGKGTYLLSTL
jgi:predicted transcriptional regulator